MNKHIRGISIGANVRYTEAWIPCKGRVMWYDLTKEEIKELFKNFSR